MVLLVWCPDVKSMPATFDLHGWKLKSKEHNAIFSDTKEKSFLPLGSLGKAGSVHIPPLSPEQRSREGYAAK